MKKKGNYICVRTEKMNSNAKIKAAENHNKRETAYNGNIHPELTPYNRIWQVGISQEMKEMDMDKIHNEYLKRVNKERKVLGLPETRKDHVRAVEYVFTASKTIFEENPQNQEKFEQAVIKYMKGVEVPARIYFHADESTFHAHVLMIPVRGLGGEKPRFAAKEIMSGRENCSQMQTDFAECCQQLGLNVSRGIKKSKNKHTELKQYYEMQNQALQTKYEEESKNMEIEYQRRLDQQRASYREQITEKDAKIKELDATIDKLETIMERNYNEILLQGNLLEEKVAPLWNVLTQAEKDAYNRTMDSLNHYMRGEDLDR